MLKVITTQKDPKLIAKVFEPVLKNSGVKHKFSLLEQVVDGDSGLFPFENTDVILGLGTKVLDWLVVQGVKPPKKGAKLDAFRGAVHEVNGLRAMVSYDPFMITIDPDYQNKIMWDIRLACRYHKTNSLLPILGDYKYVEDFYDIHKILHDRISESGSPQVLSVDLETIGIDPFAPNARIVSISLTYRVGYSHVYYCDETGQLPPNVRAQLSALFTNPLIKVTGANLKFDIIWIKRHWDIWITNQTFDTYLVGTLLDENRGNSLKDHTKAMTDMGGYEDDLKTQFDMARMDLVPKEILLTYAGGDTDACLRVTHNMRADLIKDPALTRFYVDLLQPASKVFAKLEYRGVVVDAKRYDQLEQECIAEKKKLEDQILSSIPRRIRLKFGEVGTEDKIKPSMIKEFLFTPRGLNLTPLVLTEKEQEPSTAKDHLKHFITHEKAGPFVKSLMEYSGVSKTLSTYIQGFKKHLRSDGKFHPTYLMGRGGSTDSGEMDGGTVSGRLSCTGPAYQTITKRGAWASKLRSVYIPPPGMCILQFDFSQGELKIIADRGPEPTMLQTYLEGKDIHTKTAAEMSGITYDALLAMDDDTIELKRYSAKALNFGFVYGLQPEGFVEYAWVGYGLELTLSQSQQYRDTFFKLYNKLDDWHKDEIRFAHRHGFVRNPLGRVRHLPLINSKDWTIRSRQERQGVNSPIQSGLSDTMQLAMVELDRKYPELWIFGNTHDALEMYVPIGEHEMWAYRVRDVIRNLPLSHFGWRPKLELTIDFKYSNTNLGDLKKIKLAA